MKSYYVDNQMSLWGNLKINNVKVKELKGIKIKFGKAFGCGFLSVFTNKKEAKKNCKNGFVEVRETKKGGK